MKNFFLLLVLLVAILILSSCEISKETTNKFTESSNRETTIIGEYTVNFDYQFDNKFVTSKSSSFKVTEPVIPTRSGYTFEGWYYNDLKWVFVGYSVTEPITLTAHWILNTYNIDYNMWGGVNSSLNPKQYTIESIIKLTEPTRKGYTFSGWTYKDQVTPLKSVIIEKGTLGTKTFNANWVVNTYKITFDSNGGKDVASLEVTYDSSFSLPTPTREGFSFWGWCRGNYKYNQIGKWDIDADMELKAVWIKGELSADNTIRFGTYEQDNNMINGNEEIEWIILDVQDGKALLLSKYAIDSLKYNDTSSTTGMTWENCTLRKWLNSTFIDIAFNAEQKPLIPYVNITNPANPSFSTEGGNNTIDRIFLLNINEARKYLPSANDIMCEGTKFAENNHFNGHLNSTNGKCYWWLRTPGLNNTNAIVAHPMGSIYVAGHNIWLNTQGIRPALWVNIVY